MSAASEELDACLDEAEMAIEGARGPEDDAETLEALRDCLPPLLQRIAELYPETTLTKK